MKGTKIILLKMNRINYMYYIVMIFREKIETYCQKTSFEKDCLKFGDDVKPGISVFSKIT